MPRYLILHPSIPPIIASKDMDDSLSIPLGKMSTTSGARRPHFHVSVFALAPTEMNLDKELMRAILFDMLVLGGRSTGRTADSGSANGGSSPSLPAIFFGAHRG